MKKWWVSKEADGSGMQHVTADVLKVEAGCLLFYGPAPERRGGEPRALWLALSPGEWKTVYLDQEHPDEKVKQ